MSVSLDRLGGLILGLELMRVSINCTSCDDTLEALKCLYVILSDQVEEEERRLARYRRGGRKKPRQRPAPFRPQLVVANVNPLLSLLSPT